MKREQKRHSMKIVIVGDGKVGNILMRQLSKEGHDIVIIDNKPEVLEQTLNSYDIMAIEGNGATYGIQKSAGVDKADLLIAATSGDELNMLSCMVGKKLGVKYAVSRVRNPEYAEQLFLMRDELGIDMVINPEYTAAQEISRILRFPTALKVETFTRGRAELVEIKIQENSKLDGQPLFSMAHKYQVKILVCAVQRDDQIIIPTGDFVLKAGDKISITGTAGEILHFFKRTGILMDKIKSVMIVGGSRTGYYLSKTLIESGMEVQIVEMDKKRCLELSVDLPKATVIHGNGTDHELLSELGIEDIDAFVSLTNIDEENIILSMYAMKKKVQKVITKVNKRSFTKLLSTDLADGVISPKYLAANQIISYVRGLQNTVGCNVQTLHRIIENQVEVLEFAIRIEEDFIHVPLKDLRIRENVLVACILRKNRTIIPGGDDVIEVGDNVIVVTTIPYLRDFTDILKL